MQFKCILESDIIINQKSATEGNQETLDFIPGNNFLGITAASLTDGKSLYERLGEDAFTVFHSGKIRFGDAHPAKEDIRSLRVPASWFVPKIKNENNKDLLLVHHHINVFEEYRNEQPKQCRTGFYIFKEQKAIEIPVEKSFAIKSAYNKDKRRAMDEQMYGYQSMDKGLELIFEISVDDDLDKSEEEYKKLLEDLKNSVSGSNKKVGRSRTAQYGLVTITPLNEEWENVINIKKLEDTVYIYADSRLIFTDNYGLPTFTPEANDFKLTGKINWAKSQIRTFQYSPWNFKRQARDADRCGIEKGSVIVVENVDPIDNVSQYVGYYQNEGFGKVIYNPDFLQEKNRLDDVQANGKSSYKFIPYSSRKEKYEDEEQTVNNICILKQKAEKQSKFSVLLHFLANQKEQEMINNKIYKLVYKYIQKEYIDQLFTKSNKKEFASQWSTIRNKATQTKQFKELIMCIIGGEIKETKNSITVEIVNTKAGYITHGIAAEKWKDSEMNVLKNFFIDIHKQNLTEYASIALINLATEMANNCGGTRNE